MRKSTSLACSAKLKRFLNPLDEIVPVFVNILPTRMHDAPSVRRQLVQSVSIIGPRSEVLMITIAIGLDDQSLFWVREIDSGNELFIRDHHELSLRPR